MSFVSVMIDQGEEIELRTCTRKKHYKFNNK